MLFHLLAAAAKAAAAQERPSVGRISLKSGVMSYAGTPLAGNKMEAIVLVAGYRNVWYAGRYDANNIVNPNCFALDLSDDGMAPHENVSDPAHTSCHGCPNAEWGSDPNGGRGKACKQTRRLVLLPATATTPEAIRTAEMALLDLPVTSVKNYSNFVNTLAAGVGVPTWAAVTEISVVPDAKTQFKVSFRALSVLPSNDHIAAVQARMDSAKALVLEPYAETAGADDEPPAAAAPKATANGRKKF